MRGHMNTREKVFYFIQTEKKLVKIEGTLCEGV